MNCAIGADVEQAADLLMCGRLVAFPTETVYGLGANALDPQAVARIFQAKNRPHFDPLIVHLADSAWLERVVEFVPEHAERLIKRFWPGPLTLVLHKRPVVPDLVTSGLQTVGVRIPAHPLALSLLRRTGTPIAAPSANLFGQVSPTTALHVAEQLGERIDYVLDGGPCTVGVESTVLDLSHETPTLLRPGGVSLEQIEQVIGPVRVADAASRRSGALSSPGLSAQHYATRTPLIIAIHNDDLPQSGKIGLLALVREPSVERFAAVEILSEEGDLAQAAVHLFAAMRRMDDRGLELIVARPVPETGLGRAINDRLRRAAHANEFPSR